MSYNRLPTTLSDWAKNYREANRTPLTFGARPPCPINREQLRPQESLSTLSSYTVDRLRADSDRSDSSSSRVPDATTKSDFRQIDASSAKKELEAGDEVDDQSVNNDFTEQRDVAIQTDITEEQLLLNLLKSCPDFIDLIRVTMK